MYKPHIRKVDPTANDREVWHCSLRRSATVWWHEYGYSWRSALDKMEARLAKYETSVHEPLTPR